MTSIRQSADMALSQSSQVIVGENHPLQPAQKLQDDSLDGFSTKNTQHVIKNAREDLSTSDQESVRTSFMASLHQYSTALNESFDTFQEDINTANPQKESIDDFDWEELEATYQKEIGDIVMRERDIMNQFDTRFKVGRVA